MTKQERASLYLAYLTDEGYRPETDGDGDVRFKHEGGTYFIIIHEDDEIYFQLAYPNFWSIESEEERERVTQAAVVATRETKVAKVFPVGDDTWATIEMFISPPEAFEVVFRRCLSALQAAVARFRAEVLD